MQITNDRLEEAVKALGDLLGDEEMIVLSVGNPGDRGVVIAAQGDTAEQIVKIVEGLTETTEAREAREKRISQYQKPKNPGTK